MTLAQVKIPLINKILIGRSKRLKTNSKQLRTDAIDTQYGSYEEQKKLSSLRTSKSSRTT